MVGFALWFSLCVVLTHLPSYLNFEPEGFFKGCYMVNPGVDVSFTRQRLQTLIPELFQASSQ